MPIATTLFGLDALAGDPRARAAIAFGVALAASLLAGPATVRWLRALRVSDGGEKNDSDELDARHAAKRGTPTMGGVLIVVAALLAIALAGRVDLGSTWLFAGAVGTLAAIGMVDDLVKLRTSGRGLSRRQKLGLLAIVAFAIGVASFAERLGDQPAALAAVGADDVAPLGRAAAPAAPAPGSSSSAASASSASALAAAPLHATGRDVPAKPVGGDLAVPFASAKRISLGLAYVLFAALLVLATTNAVNFTDGLDGLCAGSVAIVLCAFCVIAYAIGDAGHAAYLGFAHVPEAAEALVLGAAVLGATIGFLWFNAHPARVFMGDTGSLALGGAVALLALQTRHELWLVLAGGVFVLEGASVVLQIAYFKMTGGKRLFRIAPIHHHYQFLGLYETQVTTRMWILGAVCAVLALAALGGPA